MDDWVSYFTEMAVRCRRLAEGLPHYNETMRCALIALALEFEAKAEIAMARTTATENIIGGGDIANLIGSAAASADASKADASKADASKEGQSR